MVGIQKLQYKIRGQRHSKPYCSVNSTLSAFSCCYLSSGNFYGTPKPPAEPSPFQADPVDQVLFDNEFDAESQRKRTTSVSKMERMDSSLPEEEEDEDKETVNGSGNAGL